MNYNDPLLNIMVLSPGRTGSMLICKVLEPITPRLRRWVNNQCAMKPKEILHSHMPNDVHLGNEHTQYILSTRNIIETTYSSIIGHHYDRWQYTKNAQVKIEPFTSSIERFVSLYERTANYYKMLKLVLPNNILKIDYSEFKDDIKNLYDKLELHPMYYRMSKVNLTKTPGAYRDWIINFDEINEVASTLDPTPDI